MGLQYVSLVLSFSTLEKDICNFLRNSCQDRGGAGLISRNRWDDIEGGRLSHPRPSSPLSPPASGTCVGGWWVPMLAECWKQRVLGEGRRGGVLRGGEGQFAWVSVCKGGIGRIPVVAPFYHAHRLLWACLLGNFCPFALVRVTN